jgi:hypothetical protein
MTMAVYLGAMPAPTRPGTPVSAPRPAGAFWIASGAAWRSLALTTTDLPCGFTDLASAKAYYDALTAGRGFTGLDAMSWISKTDAVLAVGLSPKPSSPPTLGQTEFVLYCNVNAVSRGAHCFTQLGQPYTHVQPIASVSACQANGVSYVAMAPFPPSGSPSTPLLTNCCMIVGWTKAPHGTLTPA